MPADCVLVKIENKNNECFVKTVALDGERNLKPKLVCRFLSNNFDAIFNPTRSVSAPCLTIDTMTPVKDLYTYRGKINANIGVEKCEQHIDINTFLHRASFLENSQSVIALVIHTGSDTKIQMNLGQYKFKMSRFERVLNGILIGNLVLAFILNFINLGLFARWTKANMLPKNKYLWYKVLNPDKTVPKGKLLLKAFMSVYLIVNQFIPLDLLVAIEISKLILTGLMEWDTQMMVEDNDVKDVVGFRANHLGLHEELALVDYVFCDKTGTLTQNEMVFRALSIQDGQCFYYDAAHPVSSMKVNLQQSLISAETMESVRDLFRCMGICHDCIVVKDKKDERRFSYSGPSVDEVALHQMAQDSGIGFFCERSSNTFTIKVEGKLEEYELLKIFPFDSVRKCMSVLVKNPKRDGEAILFVKGADSSVLPLIAETKVSNKG